MQRNGSRLRKAAPAPPVSYLSGPMLPPSTAPIPVLAPPRRKRSTPRMLSPIRTPSDDAPPEETEIERKAREEKEEYLRFLMTIFPFHYCVACHKCVSPIEQGTGRFCPMCDYGHILRLATFNDMKQSKVPNLAPSDGREVNEIPAFALLEMLPDRMAKAHHCIELIVAKMSQLRKLLEELQDLHSLAEEAHHGTDADTKALMLDLLSYYPKTPSMRKMWPVVNAAVKSIDRRFEEIGPGGLRPDLARVCNPTCGLHGQSAEELAFQSASVPLSMHELLTQGSSASLGMK